MPTPLHIRETKQFRRDIKRLKRQGLNIDKLKAVITKLVYQDQLEDSLRDHLLVGNWRGFRECHIQPDWLLIYRVDNDAVELARTGRHAELLR